MMNKKEKIFFGIIIATMLIAVFLPPKTIYSHFFMCLAALKLSVFMIYGGLKYNPKIDKENKKRNETQSTSALPGEKLEDIIFKKTFSLLPWWAIKILFVLIGILFLIGSMFLVNAFINQHF